MKKYRICTLILILSAMVLIFAGCGTDSIMGTWHVMSAQLDGETIAVKDFARYMGSAFARKADSELIFQSSGFVKIYVPAGGTKATEETVRYAITDNIIELYDEDKHLAYLGYDGNTIRMEISADIYLVFTK